jgi:hypothetical protein
MQGLLVKARATDENCEIVRRNFSEVYSKTTSAFSNDPGYIRLFTGLMTRNNTLKYFMTIHSYLFFKLILCDYEPLCLFYAPKFTCLK